MTKTKPNKNTSSRRDFLVAHINRELVDHKGGDLEHLVECALGIYNFRWNMDSKTAISMPVAMQAAIVRAIADHAEDDELNQLVLDALNQEAAHKHQAILFDDGQAPAPEVRS